MNSNSNNSLYGTEKPFLCILPLSYAMWWWPFSSKYVFESNRINWYV